MDSVIDYFSNKDYANRDEAMHGLKSQTCFVTQQRELLEERECSLRLKIGQFHRGNSVSFSDVINGNDKANASNNQEKDTCNCEGDKYNFFVYPKKKETVGLGTYGVKKHDNGKCMLTSNNGSKSDSDLVASKNKIYPVLKKSLTDKCFLLHDAWNLS